MARNFHRHFENETNFIIGGQKYKELKSVSQKESKCDLLSHALDRGTHQYRCIAWPRFDEVVKIL